MKTQSQINKKRLLSLAVLMTVTAGFYFFVDNKKQGTVDVDLFKVAEQEQVDRVTLESPQGKVELHFDGTRWMVNDKYDADRQSIKILFATLDKAEPKRPVSSSQQDSISSILNARGVTVSLYKGNLLEQEFMAGGNDRKTESWFKHPDGPPYIMAIPGYRAYVSYVLELDENDWRDKRIFNFNWRNFKSLKAIMKEPGQDFEVSFTDNYFTIKGINSIDTTRLNDYLDAVSLLSADQILSAEKSKQYDSLAKTAPSIQLQVSDIADQLHSLQLWAPGKNDPYVLGRWAEGDLVLFSREKMVPIARKRSYFSVR